MLKGVKQGLFILFFTDSGSQLIKLSTFCFPKSKIFRNAVFVFFEKEKQNLENIELRTLKNELTEPVVKT